MAIRFDGKVAIVTGGGNGLGRAYALELARRGANVVVNDFGGARDGTGGSTSPAETVAAEIGDGGGKAIANAADVSDPGQCRDMAAQALDEWGRIDILINNAGILRDKSFGKMDDDRWRTVIDVHLSGSAYASRAVWGAMKEQGYGRILMTTSTSGIYGNFGQANYGAAKTGAIGLMNTLCIEGAKNDIRANCIAPTAATRLTEDVMAPQMLAMLDPESVVPAAIHLVSDDAPNRTIMLAGAGTYATLEIRESKGLFLPEDERSAETVAGRFGEISDMADSDCFDQISQHLAKIMTNATKAAKS